MATGTQSATEQFLKNMSTHVCENDHPMAVGAKFCSECGGTPKAATLSPEDRLALLEAVIFEGITNANQEADPKPEETSVKEPKASVSDIFKKIGKGLVTPIPEKK